MDLMDKSAFFMTSQDQGIRRVWAWAPGRALKTKRGEMLLKAKDLGLTDVVLVLNDATTSRAWHTFEPIETIKETIGIYKEHGIAPHVMSWAVANQTWMSKAAGVLNELAPLVRTVMLDAEEPWTVKGSDSAGLAAAFKRAWAHGCPLGLTGITLHPKLFLEPLIRISDYLVPQAYSYLPKDDQKAAISVYHPGQTQKLAHKRWKTYGLPLVLGLAGYQQKGAGGLSEVCAVEKSIMVTQGLEEPLVNEVAYWALHLIKGDTAAVVKNLCGKARG